MRKADVFTHCIDWFTDDNGIINFKIVEYENTVNTLVSFANYATARERIENWIDEYALCLRYCHLTSDEAICFNHQIKKCNGICAGEEEITIYNKRAKEIIDSIIFKNEHFALIDHGKTPEERSIILVENRHYVGYGYIDRTDTFSSLEECRAIVNKATFYPDADDLIRGFLKTNKLKTIVFKNTKEDFF